MIYFLSEGDKNHSFKAGVSVMLRVPVSIRSLILRNEMSLFSMHMGDHIVTAVIVSVLIKWIFEPQSSKFKDWSALIKDKWLLD